MNSNTESMPENPTYSYSLKLEETTKGVRISVHIYANNLQTAVNEAIKLNQTTKQKAEQEKFPVAPMELK